MRGVEVLATVTAVAVAVSLLITSDLPEQVSCGIEGAVTSVTDPADRGEAAAPQTCTDEQDDSAPAASDRAASDVAASADDRTGGGLTARLDSADSVAAPGRAAMGPSELLALVPAGQRCSPSLAYTPSLVCLRGSDGAVSGTDVIERCTAIGGFRTLACHPTDSDPGAQFWPMTTEYNPDQGRKPVGAAWCQVVQVQHTPGDDVPVDWACAATTSEVHFCTTRVPRTAAIGDLFDRTAWTRVGWSKDPAYQPGACHSRTAPDPEPINCSDPNPSGHATCTIAAFDTQPDRPVTCILFTALDDDPVTHTTGKPLHCISTEGTDDEDVFTEDATATCVEAIESRTSDVGHGLSFQRGPGRRPLAGEWDAATHTMQLFRACQDAPPGTVIRPRFVPRLLDPLYTRGGTLGDRSISIQDISFPTTPDIIGPLAPATANVARLQALLDRLGDPDLSPIPVVLLMDDRRVMGRGRRNPDMSARVVKLPHQGGRFIFLGRGYEDNLFVLAHEYGHSLAFSQGMVPVSRSDVGMFSLHEGFADSFAYLLTGETFEREAPALAYSHLLPFDFKVHSNGVLVVRLIEGVQRLWRPQLRGTRDQRLLKILIATAKDPRLSSDRPSVGRYDTTLFEEYEAFRAAFIEAAVAEGIPLFVVLEAFEQLHWHAPGEYGINNPLTCDVTCLPR